MNSPSSDQVARQLTYCLKALLARASAEQLRLILFAAFHAMSQIDRRALIDHAREITMPRREKKRAEMKRIVLALLDSGYSKSEIVEITQVPTKRVQEIIVGRLS